MQGPGHRPVLVTRPWPSTSCGGSPATASAARTAAHSDRGGTIRQRRPGWRPAGADRPIPTTKPRWKVSTPPAGANASAWPRRPAATPQPTSFAPRRRITTACGATAHPATEPLWTSNSNSTNQPMPSASQGWPAIPGRPGGVSCPARGEGCCRFATGRGAEVPCGNRKQLPPQQAAVLSRLVSAPASSKSARPVSSRR